MEPVFYRPVTADRLNQHGGIIAAARQEVADIDLAGAVDPADSFYCQRLGQIDRDECAATRDKQKT